MKGRWVYGTSGAKAHWVPQEHMELALCGLRARGAEARGEPASRCRTCENLRSLEESEPAQRSRSWSA